MPKERIAERLEECGAGADRLVDVADGTKASHDHTTYEPTRVTGNYGIYATPGDTLVIIDVDDYDDGIDESALSALSRLPPTLEQKTPHDGTHRIYSVEKTVEGEYVADVLEAEIGKKNPTPTWGEVRVANQYVVSAGSELTGCDKEWCDACETDDGGHYTLHADREIATIQPADLIEVLRADPNYAEEEADETADVDDFDPDLEGAADEEEILSYALKESDDEKLKRLWRGDYSDYSNDRSRAESALAYKLAFWLGGDRSTGETKSLVEKALDGRLTPSGVSGPSLEKWGKRTDAAYRQSVLEAVGKQSEFYEPSASNGPTPEEIDERFENGPDDAENNAANWGYVRSLYEDSDVDKKRGRYAAVRQLQSKFEFATSRQTEHLLIYQEELGIYERGGRLDVERELNRGLGAHYTTHEANEIIARLKAATYRDMDVFDAGEFDEKLLCVENGVLNLETRDLREHDPKYYFRSRLPVAYDPDAECPTVEEFMQDITRREADRKTMYEMVGNTLWPNYDHAGFLVLHGEGSNGKSTFFELVEELIGTENVSSWGLKDLEENRFATANLVDKMANIAPDLARKKIKDLGTLKALTGGDTVMAERKGEQAFEFENRATMMFGANRPPVLGERTHAVARRLYPIQLPYEFTTNPNDGKKDAVDRAELMEDLTSDEELSGLLNKALDGIDRLNDDGDFSMPEGPEERLEMYEKHSDPIKEFRVTCLDADRDASITKDAVYEAYSRFCEANDHTKANRPVFFRQLNQTTLTIDEHRPQLAAYGGEQKRSLKGVEFTEMGLTHLPTDLKERLGYDVDESDDADESDENDENDDTAPYNARPVSEVAKDPTGYATVTVDVLKIERPENGPKIRATVKDETSAVDVITWEADATELLDLEEGATVAIVNAGVDEYQGKAQLVIETGVTEVRAVQKGVGHTTPAAPESVDESADQTSLDAAEKPADDTDAETSADGGRVEENPGDVPDDADGLLADARRLNHILRENGALSESSLFARAADRYDMSPDRAADALDKAKLSALVAETPGGKYESG